MKIIIDKQTIINKQIEELKKLRNQAYVLEADPLFFKSQRGESTVEEWQAKIDEIKARYPYPGE
jgi:hypothetical protein